jgi:hypothetical protein
VIEGVPRHLMINELFIKANSDQGHYEMLQVMETP